MTEADWLASTDPQAMLAFLRDSGRATDRKLRLFAVACCRSIWHLLADPRSRTAVEVAERRADGLASDAKLNAACLAAGDGASGSGDPAAFAAVHAADHRKDFALGACLNAAHARGDYNEFSPGSSSFPQAALLRDLFGDPFRPAPAIDPAWLAWRGGTVRRLAVDAYEQWALTAGTLDPQRLAVLADALQDAGSADADLLGHLRRPGPHTRGCWAVELLIGRG